MAEIELMLTVDEGFTSEDAAELQQALRSLEGVDDAEVEADRDEADRDAMAVIGTVSVVLTAAGGAAAGLKLLLDRIREVVLSARGLKEAIVRTPQGEVPLPSVTAEELAEEP